MNLGDPMHQKLARAGPTPDEGGEAPGRRRGGEGRPVVHGNERSGSGDLLGRIVERDNMRAALKRVQRNRGSPGVDGMSVDELAGYLRAHWTMIREQLLAGCYRPQAVLRCEIPKAGGGTRGLGIPTVVDRLIQQAVLQVLQARFDPGFSASSYGFRPGRSAHDAVTQARRYLQEGRRIVVDVDLEQFFDRVNHDVLMARLAQRIEDKRLLRLIRRYLEAGMLVGGVVMQRREGTPQGGPLSPLLANVLLDEVDKALERRGHAFVRYADDCNVYVRSVRAGERVMAGLRKLYARMHLRVNDAKSAVAKATTRPFLGYRFFMRRGEGQCAVAPKAWMAMKERVRQLTARSRGRSFPQIAEELRSYLPGWRAYFRLAQTPAAFRDLDEWIRHRLRMAQLRQWKRGTTTYRALCARGTSASLARIVAANARRWCRNSGTALNLAMPNAYFDALGLPRMVT